MRNENDAPITLYGAPMSMYTGRVRSYFIKSGIDYREQGFATRHFYDTVLPQAGGRRSMPTIEFPDGTVIRDSVAIVDHFEAERGESASPATPCQRIVSRLLDVIGSEGLLRPAMHYRWDFDDEQLDFLRLNWLVLYPDRAKEDPDEVMRQVREEVNPAWGITPDTVELIESLYLELLEKLDAHFANHPYFLGGKPSIGDYGMIAPLYAHLGRDPVPRSLMQQRAAHAFRWVERMNSQEPDLFEFPGYEQDFLPDDEIPGTLIEVLQHFAIDFVPETRAACERINRFLDENADLVEGTVCRRGEGRARFELNGIAFSTMAQPFRFYLLKRMQDEFEALDGASRTAARELLEACGMSELLELKLSRAIGRQDNLEVWLGRV